MFLVKWILASIVLRTNALQYVSDNLKLRINGTEGVITLKEMYSKVIPLNFWTLYPICNIKGIKRQLKILSIIVLTITILIDWKKIRKSKYALLLIVIAIVPYIRYIILANHSYKHFFFTYREQIISIIALGMIICEYFNTKLWCKKISINHLKKKKEK